MKKIKSLNIAILTISDSRNEKTDKSGNILKKKINNSVHKVFEKKICKDEKKEIELTLKHWLKQDDLNVIIASGGTGLTRRDIALKFLKNFSKKKFLALVKCLDS